MKKPLSFLTDSFILLFFQGSKIINRQRKIVHLLVKIDKIQYILGTLRFNACEFSYFFTYPSDSPKIHLHRDNEKSIYTLDHITWHNSRIHIKRKDNITVAHADYPGRLLSTPPILTPLYVESHYFNRTPCLIKKNEFTPWGGSKSQEVLSLDASTGFSLAFFLSPSTISTPEILMGLQFLEIPRGLSYPPSLANLCDLKHRPGRIKVWENWDLIILTTPFIQSIISPILPVIGALDAYRLLNYSNTEAALVDLMLQANGLN
jgi:hypothetical protein